MADDTTQRAAHRFLLEHLQSQEPFTKEDFSGATGWEKPGTVNTYLSKHYKGLIEKIGSESVSSFRNVPKIRKLAKVQAASRISSSPRCHQLRTE